MAGRGRPKKVDFAVLEKTDETPTRQAVRGREWAVGLSQKEFEIGLRERCPKLDVMPVVEEWPYFGQAPERMINLVKPDDMQYEPDGVNPG